LSSKNPSGISSFGSNVLCSSFHPTQLTS
jgi:hypothetical protein